MQAPRRFKASHEDAVRRLMPDYSLPPDESDPPQGGQGATVSLRALYLITAGLKRHGESELDPAAGVIR